MMSMFCWFLVAVVYANLAEWMTHKFILHDLGKRKHTKLGSMFSFHWSRHHRVVRKNKYYDPDYESYKLFSEEWMASQGKEIIGLSLLVLSHAWTLLLFPPIFYATLVLCAILYFIVHRKSHLDVQWGKKYLKWHWDHHMLSDQDKNFCVTFPLWDYLLRTRVKESEDAEQRRKKRANKKAH